MRFILTFQPWTTESAESAILFTTLYTAFIGAADNPNRARTLEETRAALRVLDEFDAVSDVFEVGTPGEYRKLKPAGGTMRLGEREHTLLVQAVERVAANAPFGAARTAIKLLDFVQSAQKIEVE